MAKSFASSLLCSRLDYANSRLSGTTQKIISRLQHVQSTLAKVVASHALPQDIRSHGIVKYLLWLPIEQFKLAMLTHKNLCSTQPAYLHSFWITTLPHVLYALRTLTCCLFLVFTLPLPLMALVLQPPQSGTHSHLAFVTLQIPILSAAFSKLATSGSRPLAPPSGSSASDSAIGRHYTHIQRHQNIQRKTQRDKCSHYHAVWYTECSLTSDSQIMIQQ